MEQKLKFFKTILKDFTASASSIEDYASLFDKKHFNKGDFFIKDGEQSLFTGYVLKGAFRVFLLDHEGREANIRFLLKYYTISGSFGKNTLTNTNIQSLEKSEIYLTTWDKIDNLAKTNQWIYDYNNHYFGTAHKWIAKRTASYIRLNAKERYLLLLREDPHVVKKNTTLPYSQPLRNYTNSAKQNT